METALLTARLSQDPSTKVGAVLTLGPNVLAISYNRFPYGIKEDDRMSNREVKLDLIVHAEEGCIMHAARHGIPILGSTLYVAATDGKAESWGGPPCVRCTASAIQAGIQTFISRPMKLAPSRWRNSIIFARRMIDEAGLEYREIEIPS